MAAALPSSAGLPPQQAQSLAKEAISVLPAGWVQDKKNSNKATKKVEITFANGTVHKFNITVENTGKVNFKQLLEKAEALLTTKFKQEFGREEEDMEKHEVIKGKKVRTLPSSLEALVEDLEPKDKIQVLNNKDILVDNRAKKLDEMGKNLLKVRGGLYSSNMAEIAKLSGQGVKIEIMPETPLSKDAYLPVLPKGWKRESDKEVQQKEASAVTSPVHVATKEVVLVDQRFQIQIQDESVYPDHPSLFANLLHQVIDFQDERHVSRSEKLAIFAAHLKLKPGEELIWKQKFGSENSVELFIVVDQREIPIPWNDSTEDEIGKKLKNDLAIWGSGGISKNVTIRIKRPAPFSPFDTSRGRTAAVIDKPEGIQQKEKEVVARAKAVVPLPKVVTTRPQNVTTQSLHKHGTPSPTPSPIPSPNSSSQSSPASSPPGTPPKKAPPLPPLPKSKKR